MYMQEITHPQIQDTVIEPSIQENVFVLLLRVGKVTLCS